MTRFLTELASAFGAFALILAALGVYGLTSTELAARWRELAVRQALGAPRLHVLWQTLRPGTGAVTAGVLIGGVAAVAAGRWLAAPLDGVAVADAVALTAVPLLLVCVGLVSALTAAWRVLSANPASTLRL